MRKIKKVSTVPLNPISGNITDTLNVTDKVTNAPSVHLMEKTISFNPTETQIGYWYSSPLYRRAIGGTYVGKGATRNYVDIPVGDNIRIINFYGYIKIDTNYEFPLNCYWDETQITSCIIKPDLKGLLMNVKSQNAGNFLYRIVIEYTKTS